jgi:hypothetical protein
VPEELGVLRLAILAGVTPVGLAKTPAATVAATNAVVNETMMSERTVSSRRGRVPFEGIL